MGRAETHDAVADGGSPLGVQALALLRLWQDSSHGVFVLQSSERRAERLASIIHALDPSTDVLAFPRWDRFPFDASSPSADVSGRRASVLRRLAEGGRRPLLITTPEAVLQRLPPHGVWRDALVKVAVGDRLAPTDLQGRLLALGYAVRADVETPGEVTCNGLTIDVFPAGALAPVRIEIAEGRVRSIATVDAATRHTAGDLDEIVLDPASELAGCAMPEIDGSRSSFEDAILACHSRTETMADYLPRATRIEDGRVAARTEQWLELTSSGPAPGLAGRPSRSRAAFYLSRSEWETASQAQRALSIADILPPCSAIPSFALEARPRESLVRFLTEERRRKRRIVLAAGSSNDLDHLESAANEAGSTVERVQTWADAMASKRGCASLRVDFDRGWVLTEDDVTVVTAADLLGSRARHETPFDVRRIAIAEDPEMRSGDAVLHLEHGIAVLHGLETLDSPDLKDQDVVRLGFAGETTLLVPVAELGAVWRYGGDPASVTLDTLDSGAWRKRRREVEAEIEQTATAMVSIANGRVQGTAPVLQPPPGDYERIVAGFPFVETADQADAVQDILADLRSGTPMDRLLCGDVGFGKTEVALRAAAAAVLSGKQVALVAPTTVLVRQHVETFARRLKPFGIAVAQLSRLVKPAEARRVRAGLRSGEIRLVVGTQALAGTGVAFADLGLVIIDEEQRFGIKDKAKVRALAEHGHLLAATATPIPRTLMAARMGLLSLSLLATPPARRHPVRTSRAEATSQTMREAIRQEKERGGQTFLVCPRIEDIAPMAERLRSILPDIEVKVVHGQLPPEAVDETIVAFAAGQGDVLLATDIIESGLDIPRANTMLVLHPDRFGLAQLHQLRGRVGRGARRGNAILLDDGTMAESARKRVEAFVQSAGIGAGAAISEQDMDQRGAGDLLGERQAGHVKRIGADLHRHLLERAIRQVRGEPLPEDWTPEIHIAGPCRLPPDYVTDPDRRLNLYRRLAQLRSTEEISTFRADLVDRFGPLPDPVEALVQRTILEQLCREAGIMRVDAGPLGVALTFINEARRPKSLPARAEWKDDRLVLASPAFDISNLPSLISAIKRSDAADVAHEPRGGRT